MSNSIPSSNLKRKNPDTPITTEQPNQKKPTPEEHPQPTLIIKTPTIQQPTSEPKEPPISETKNVPELIKSPNDEELTKEETEVLQKFKNERKSIGYIPNKYITKEMLDICIPELPSKPYKVPGQVGTYNPVFKFNEFKKLHPELFTPDSPIEITSMKNLMWCCPDTITLNGFSPNKSSKGDIINVLSLNVDASDFIDEAEGEDFLRAIQCYYDHILQLCFNKKDDENWKKEFQFKKEHLDKKMDDRIKETIEGALSHPIKSGEDGYSSQLKLKLPHQYNDKEQNIPEDPNIVLIDIWQKKSEKQHAKDLLKFYSLSATDQKSDDGQKLHSECFLLTDTLSPKNSTKADLNNNPEDMYIKKKDILKAVFMIKGWIDNSKNVTVGGLTSSAIQLLKPDNSQKFTKIKTKRSYF